VSRALVLRAQAGDADAFSALVEPRLDRLYGAAALIVRRADLAQDVVQEALVSAWRDLRALRDPDRFDAWVHRLLVRACYRMLRKQRTRDVRELTLTGIDAPGVSDIARAVADSDVLERAMRRLSADQRAVIVARYYLGLELAECAAVLDLPLGTVQSRLSRATSVMRAAVDADDRAGSAPAEVPA
jgi:RNA polymerase sigma-70 factor (ECF subfamily)